MNKYTELIPAYHLSSPRFTSSVTAITDAFSKEKNIINDMVSAFDLDKAVGAQLDIIGLWIGRSRRVRAPATNYFFSFDIAGLGFNQGNWKDRYDTEDGYIYLDDYSYRTILRAKIGANNWNGTTGTLQSVLNSIYPSGAISITFKDNQDMTMTITVTGKSIPIITKEIIRQGYLSIKPMGINVNYEVMEG